MVTVEDYVALLRGKASVVRASDRFYLCLFDEQLYELEEALNSEGKTLELYEALVGEHRAWLAALTDEERRRLVDYNDRQTGANTNWILDELVLDQELRARADAANAEGGA